MITTDSPLPIVDSAPTPPRRNLLQLLIGIAIKPRDTFAYLRDHGGWAWLAPLALIVILTLLSRAIAIPIERAQMEAAMQQIQEQLKPGTGGPGGGDATFFVGPGGGGGGFGNAEVQPNPFADFMFAYGLPVTTVIGGWVLCAALLIGFAWVMGGRPSVGAMLRMSAWALVPNIARLVIAIAIMLVARRVPAEGLSRAFEPTASITTGDISAPTAGGPVTITIGPGGPTGGFTGPSFGDLFVGNLLRSLDVYNLWGLILLAVGVAVTARLSWIKGLLATALYAALALCLATFPTLISFAVGGLLGGGPMMVGP